MKEALKAIETLKENGIDILKSEVLGIYFTRLELAIFLTLLIQNRIMNDSEIKQYVGLFENSKDRCIVKVAVHKFREKMKARTKVNPFLTYRDKGYLINDKFVELLTKK